MNNLFDKIQEASSYIKSKVDIKPSVGVILGTGLGSLADEIEDKVQIEYKEIPHFPISTVEGHKGQLVIGKLNGKNVIAMQGRFHYYEGYSMQEITFPIRVMKALGIETMFVTNAAGGANKSFNPGDLMIITDHINFTGDSPLIGKNDERLGDRFIDMSKTYTPEYIEIAKECAKELNINIKEGVYAYFIGPTFETPAEVKMAQIVGADAVGMSTAPEVIVAAHSGLKVIGISCIPCMASGVVDKPLSHEDVITTTKKVEKEFSNLAKNIISRI
ncbi:MAG: purine-nucleoside phosphorylase [Terrisporobacter sp.]|uniref:purine-nucleoside phosphorylase n=1 Tax=Terrisporobacter sp. TaxID=1965305 RepID=UPI002FCA1520